MQPTQTNQDGWMQPTQTNRDGTPTTHPDGLACPAPLPKATDPAHSTPAAPSAGRASTGAAAKPSDGQGRGAGDNPQRQGCKHPTPTKGNTQVLRQKGTPRCSDNPTRQPDPTNHSNRDGLGSTWKHPSPTSAAFSAKYLSIEHPNRLTHHSSR